jgi:hypothetical protein
MDWLFERWSSFRNGNILRFSANSPAFQPSQGVALLAQDFSDARFSKLVNPLGHNLHAKVTLQIPQLKREFSPLSIVWRGAGGEVCSRQQDHVTNLTLPWSLDTRTNVLYNRGITVAQPKRYLPPTRSAVPRLLEVLMLHPTTRCDHEAFDPLLRACRGLCGLILYAARSNAFFACRQQLWRSAAQSHVRSPCKISKNIGSYWI